MRQSFARKRISLSVLLLGVSLSALLVVPVLRPVEAQQEGSRNVELESTPQQSGRRLALVIGNGVYQNATPLKNPPNDAADMAQALSDVGFKVEHGINLTQKQMKFMIREFGQKLRGGGQGLFYFAGHGIQLRGRNYLIPVEADIQSETDVEDQGVDTSLVMGLMDEANNGLNVVILDACRNNPFARSFRSVTNGLAQVDAPTGTLIAYATAPGKVARDGTGRNGAYTAELLKQMSVPGLGIEELLKRVRAKLKQQTNGEQVPWESSSLVGDFYLNRAANVTSAANKPPGGATSAPVVNKAAVEQEYWDSIKNSTDDEDFRSYLKEYPDGLHAGIARNNLRKLEAAKKATNRTNSNNSASTGNNPGLNDVTRVPAEKFGVVKASAKELIQRSYNLWRGCDYDQAIKVATESISANPRSTEAYTVRGAAYLFKLEFDSALSDLREAVRLQPDNALALRWRAIAYLGRGYQSYDADYSSLGKKDAALILQLVINPKEAWEYEARGYAHFQNEKYDLAISDFNEALRLDPQYLPAYLFRGAARSWKNTDFSDSIAFRDKSEGIRLNPNFIGGYFYRGFHQSLTSHPETAIDDLSEAIRLSPKGIITYRVRAEVYSNLNQYDLAIKDYSEAIRLGEKAFLLWRASAYSSKGDYESALRDATEYINYKPSNPAGYKARESVYRKLGRVAEADADKRKVSELEKKK